MIKKILFFVVLFLLIISVSLNFYLYYVLMPNILPSYVHYDLNQNYVDDDIEEEIIENIESGKLTLGQAELEELKSIYKSKYLSIYEQCFSRIGCITQSLNKNR